MKKKYSAYNSAQKNLKKKVKDLIATEEFVWKISDLRLLQTICDEKRRNVLTREWPVPTPMDILEVLNDFVASSPNKQSRALLLTHWGYYACDMLKGVNKEKQIRAGQKMAKHYTIEALRGKGPRVRTKKA